MGLSSLPAPSEGVLGVILVNTALSISIFKGLVRSILHVVGIHLSSPTSSPDSMENAPESVEFRLNPNGSYIEEFRSRIPVILFDKVHSCKWLEQDCSVCLTQFEPESEINHLSCGHLFPQSVLGEVAGLLEPYMPTVPDSVNARRRDSFLLLVSIMNEYGG